jgi:hypothetical protein
VMRLREFTEDERRREQQIVIEAVGHLVAA